MALTTFSPSTQIKSSEVNANFTGLSDGSNDTTANSLTTFRSEYLYPAVISGGIWTGDALGSTRLGSMTAAVIQLNGRRISITAVTGRTFTASKDTYVDVLDNLDGTGTLVYTEVANNAASPALASNSIRIGIVVTAAGSIAAATSINQGSAAASFPVVSSVAYQVCDSLGNVIYRRPNQKLIGRRAFPVGGGTSTTSTTPVGMTGVVVPVLLASLQNAGNIKANLAARQFSSNNASGIADTYIYIGGTSGTIVGNGSVSGTSGASLALFGTGVITGNTTVDAAMASNNAAYTTAVQAFNIGIVLTVEVA